MASSRLATDDIRLSAGEASLSVVVQSSLLSQGRAKVGDEVLVCLPGSPAPRMRLVAAYCAGGRERCAALVAGSSALVSMTLASMDPQEPLRAVEVSAGCGG